MDIVGHASRMTDKGIMKRLHKTKVQGKIAKEHREEIEHTVCIVMGKTKR